ncbi:TraB/GumN family protein [Vallitalea maricola]|uniref:Uncharacterized protein n=1 Tax=Vallitalea maricola TaxID=3074433 RepID=A0ACB5UNU2_9FIRM|nr:hypothetical protein AN2V17_38690 [Vallitalea sp. AN17-2]
MKIYKKVLNEITIGNSNFKYVVVEKTNEIVFRAYSYEFNDTFCEVHLSWKDNYYVNPYLPSVAKIMIEYAIKKGWNHCLRNQKVILELDSELLRLTSKQTTKIIYLETAEFYQIKEMLFCMDGISISDDELVDLIDDNEGLNQYYKKLLTRYKEFRDKNNGI